MNHRLSRVVAVVGLLIVGFAGCGGDTCTEPCSERPVYKNEYFPLAVGNKWTYEQSESGFIPSAADDYGLCDSPDTFWSNRFWYITSQSDDDRGNTWFGCKEDSNMDRPPNLYFGLRPDSSIWRGFDPRILYAMVLPGRPVEGYEWTFGGDWVSRVLGDTTVAVPAGVFTCIRVLGGDPYNYYIQCYASGIGMVSFYFEGEHGWYSWALSSYIVR